MSAFEKKAAQKKTPKLANAVALKRGHGKPAKGADDGVGKAQPGTAASYILSAPNGPRNATHRQIKAAVEKVFRERLFGHG